MSVCFFFSLLCSKYIVFILFQYAHTNKGSNESNEKENLRRSAVLTQIYITCCIIISFSSRSQNKQCSDLKFMFSFSFVCCSMCMCDHWAINTQQADIWMHIYISYFYFSAKWAINHSTDIRDKSSMCCCLFEFSSAWNNKFFFPIFGCHCWLRCWLLCFHSFKHNLHSSSQCK